MAIPRRTQSAFASSSAASDHDESGLMSNGTVRPVNAMSSSPVRPIAPPIAVTEMLLSPGTSSTCATNASRTSGEQSLT